MKDLNKLCILELFLECLQKDKKLGLNNQYK